MNAYREPRPEEPPAPPRKWAPALFAIAAWTAGNFIPMPLPGVDAEALRSYLADAPSGALAPHSPQLAVSLVGTSIGTLVLLRGILAFFTHGGDEARERRWYRRIAVVFALCVAVQGFGAAIWLEGRTTADLMDVVPHKGWGFRLALAALFAASGVAVWALASVVTRARVAHGPMALFAAEVALLCGRTFFDHGRASSHDLAPLDPLLVSNLVPTVALLLVLWRRSPRAWPQRFYRGVQALSPLDLLPLPFIASSKVLTLAALAHAEANPLVIALSTAAGLVAVGLIARWLRRCEPRVTSRPALAGAVALPVVAGAVLSAGMLAGGGVPAHLRAVLTPTVWTNVALTGDAPTAERDAARIVERLVALHHRVEVVSAAGDGIRLRVAPAEGEARAVVASVLRRGDFALYRAADDQGPVLTATEPGFDGLGSAPIRSGRDTLFVYAGPTPEALAPVVRRSESTPGAVTRVYCDDDPRNASNARNRCYALRLDPRPAVTNADVASANEDSANPDDEPNVRVVFTEPGARAFEALTRASVHHVIAIVLDDRMVSAPEVMQPITGGSAHVSVGVGLPRDGMLAEARALAAVLGTQPLAGHWTLAP